MNSPKTTQIANFQIQTGPIMWPVVIAVPQEDGPEQEVSLTMFRFRRPRAFESKAFIERQQKRYQAELARFTEKAADSLAKLGEEGIALAEKDARYAPEIIAMARDTNRVALSDEEFAAKQNEVFSMEAERKHWWLGWKPDSMKHESGRSLDFNDPDDVEYLFDSQPNLANAIDVAITEIHRGARQKNLKP